MTVLELSDLVDQVFALQNGFFFLGVHCRPDEIVLSNTVQTET
jgi:hypothetical protein